MLCDIYLSSIEGLSDHIASQVRVAIRISRLQHFGWIDVLHLITYIAVRVNTVDKCWAELVAVVLS